MRYPTLDPSNVDRRRAEKITVAEIRLENLLQVAEQAMDRAVPLLRVGRMAGPALYLDPCAQGALVTKGKLVLRRLTDHQVPASN